MFKKITVLFVIFLHVFCFVVQGDDIEPDLLWNFEKISSEVSSPSTDDFPIINARHAVVFDRNSGTIIYGKHEREKCKMASTTKIMTSLIVLENCNLDDIITVSAKSASTGGSRLGLSKNDSISVKDLLYGLMLKSRK